MRRLALLFALVVGMAGVVAASAAADHTTNVYTNALFASTPDVGMCSFPVSLVARADWTETLFYDRDGVLFRLTRSVDFAGNVFVGPSGTTVVGEPYHANELVHLTPSGDVIDVIWRGGQDKVHLPDGTVFQWTGMIQLLPPDFAVTVDMGNAKNLDRFCAALAP